MGRLALTVLFACFLGACGGAGDGPGDGGSAAVAPPGGTALPPGSDDPGQDDGSGWPRWKNPCPGPACDPYRNDPRWLVDPPPDAERVRIRVIAPERVSSPAER